MLNFVPFSLDELIKVLPSLRQQGIPCSDFSAGAMFMWQEGTDLGFCTFNDTLIIKQNKGEQPAFCWPIGKDENGAVDELLKYVQSNNLPLRFFGVDEKTLNKILGDDRLKYVSRAFDSRWSDYVYSFQTAKSFTGKKFGGQRNHINKFKKLYGEPVIRFLLSEDVAAVQNMLSLYKAEHSDANKLENLEFQQTQKLLSVYDALGMYAAGLFVGGNLAAFSIGEVVGDVLFIHVEKALKSYQGAYPTMYNGFVRLMDTLPGLDLKTVNREDDSGDPGLKTSKTQYQPIGKINKYSVRVNAPIKKITHIPDIFTDSVILTPFRQTDKPEYLALNTDVFNNRFWGYDYRQDAGITGPITQDTFFNSAAFDMQAGDSINFAVRLSENGKMIGEVILWNFTYNDRAELGCRLLPEYQGMGYGKAAFKAAASFAKDALNLKVYARCFKQNLPSGKMILSSGFTPDFSTDIYDYYKFN